MARRITSGQQAPEQQICQWLFAFGAAAMATFRALALLAAHPEQLERARPETAHGIAELQPHRPLLFSGGPAHCPGQNIVLLLTSGMLAALIGDRQIRLADPRRLPPGKLPGTQDHLTLRFELSQRASSQRDLVSAGWERT
jgi:hypothetical protein